MGAELKASAILLIVGIAISGICLANYMINIQPRHHYFSESIDCLKEAQEETALDKKILNIDEAMEIYKQGISQRNLQALETLQEAEIAEEIDYWIPKVMQLLDDEQSSLNFPLRGITITLLLSVFVGVCAIGSFSDCDSWGTDERHLYVAVVFALMLAIIVGFIP